MSELDRLVSLVKAAADPGVTDHQLSVVRTALDGVSCDVLAVVVTHEVSATRRVEPIAVFLTDEDADRLVNPLTGHSGLPWIASLPAEAGDWDD